MTETLYFFIRFEGYEPCVKALRVTDKNDARLLDEIGDHVGLCAADQWDNVSVDDCAMEDVVRPPDFFKYRNGYMVDAEMVSRHLPIIRRLLALWDLGDCQTLHTLASHVAALDKQ